MYFNPQVHLTGTRTDNAFFASEDSGDEREATGYHLGIALPFYTTRRFGTLNLTYTGQYAHYDRMKELDNFRQRLSFGLSMQPTIRTGLNLGLNYSVSEDHFDILRDDDSLGDLEGDALFVTRRVAREHAGANFGFSERIFERWSFGLSGGYGISDYEEIEGGGIPEELEGRTQIVGSASGSRRMGPVATLGVRYSARRFELDKSGDSTVQSLGLFVDLGEGLEIRRRRTTISFDFGVHLKNDERKGGETIGVQGGLGITHELRRYSLRFGLSHRPTWGGALLGTADTSRASLTLSPLRLEAWSWDVSLRYGRRDPDLADQNVIDSYGVAASVQRSLGPMVGLRLSSSWLTQGEHSADANDIDALRSSIGLVFYPLARSPRSRGVPLG